MTASEQPVSNLNTVGPYTKKTTLCGLKLISTPTQFQKLYCKIVGTLSPSNGVWPELHKTCL